MKHTGLARGETWIATVLFLFLFAFASLLALPSAAHADFSVVSIKNYPSKADSLSGYVNSTTCEVRMQDSNNEWNGQLGTTNLCYRIKSTGYADYTEWLAKSNVEGGGVFFTDRPHWLYAGDGVKWVEVEVRKYDWWPASSTTPMRCTAMSMRTRRCRSFLTPFPPRDLPEWS